MTGCNLAICVPLSWPWAPREFLTGLLGMVMPANWRDMRSRGVESCRVLVDKSFPLDVSRNRLVTKALELGATHVLFLDADMTFPPDLAQSLLAAEVDICGALYFKRTPPFAPVPSHFAGGDDPQMLTPVRLPEKPGLVECDVLGMGATLIRRQVFDALDKPWFRYEAYRPTGEMIVTEDVPFCRDAGEAGFRVACDTRVVCGHLRREVVGPGHWRTWRKAVDAEEVN